MRVLVTSTPVFFFFSFYFFFFFFSFMFSPFECMICMGQYYCILRKLWAFLLCNNLHVVYVFFFFFFKLRQHVWYVTAILNCPRFVAEKTPLLFPVPFWEKKREREKKTMLHTFCNTYHVQFSFITWGGKTVFGLTLYRQNRWHWKKISTW